MRIEVWRAIVLSKRDMSVVQELHWVLMGARLRVDCQPKSFKSSLRLLHGKLKDKKGENNKDMELGGAATGCLSQR